MNSFHKSFSLKFKMFFGFGLIMSLTIGSGVFYFTQIQRLDSLSKSIAELWLPGIIKTAELKEIATSIHEKQLAYLLAEGEARTAAEDKLSEDMGRFQIYMKTFGEGLIGEEDIDLFTQAQEQWDLINTNNDQFLELVKEKKDAEAKQFLLGKINEPFFKLKDLLTNLSDRQYEGGMDAVNLSGAAFKTTEWVSMISSALVIILSLFVSFTMYLLITRSLRRIIAELRGCADDTNKSSQELSTTSQSLSTDAQAASSSITETAAAIEEITLMLERTASHASTSKEKSEASKNSVIRGQEASVEMNNAMNELDHGMENIDQQIKSVLGSLTEIVEFMGKIGQKTMLINDIVFQTKLLSFNASVEAARAGELGKGFAVVASEVGKLAEMSGKASKEINSIVEESHTKVTSIVSDTKTRFESLLRENVEKVQQSRSTVEVSSQVLQEIVSSVGEVSTLVNEISTASEEQSKGVREISVSIRQLDTATQNNSASSEHISTSAGRMTNQVSQLMTSIQELEILLHGQKKVENHKLAS